LNIFEIDSFHKRWRRKIRKEGERRGVNRKTKTACYAKEDLCRWALSSRFIVRQCLHNSKTMPALRRLAGDEQNGARLFSSFPFPLPLFLALSLLSLSLSLSRFFWERRNDVGRKNKRNNGFIISGLQRRSRRRHCSLAFSGRDAECLPKSIRILLALNGRSNLCGITCCL